MNKEKQFSKYTKINKRGVHTFRIRIPWLMKRLHLPPFQSSYHISEYLITLVKKKTLFFPENSTAC